jgi:hypothetical protein
MDGKIRLVDFLDGVSPIKRAFDDAHGDRLVHAAFSAAYAKSSSRRTTSPLVPIRFNLLNQAALNQASCFPNGTKVRFRLRKQPLGSRTLIGPASEWTHGAVEDPGRFLPQ